MVGTAPQETPGHGGNEARSGRNLRVITLAVVVAAALAVAAVVLLRPSGPSNATAAGLEAALLVNKTMSLAGFISILNGTIGAADQNGTSNVTYSGFVNVSANSGSGPTTEFSFSYAIPFNATELANGSHARADMRISAALGALSASNATVYVDAIRNGTRHYVCGYVSPGTTGFRCHSADMNSLSALYGQALGASARPDYAALLDGINVKVTGESGSSYNGKPCTLFTATTSGSMSGLWSMLSGGAGNGSAVAGPAPELNGTLSACFDSAPGPLIPLNVSAVLGMASRVNGGVAEFTISLQMHEVSMGEPQGIDHITGLPGPLVNGSLG